MSKYDKTREALTKMVGEQFDKNINVKVMMDVRNKLICKNVL